MHMRADWLLEWIAKQGKYVRLGCGHRMDVKGEVTLTTLNGRKEVWCYDCQEAVDIGQSIGLFEFHYGYKQEPLPEEPPF